MLGAHIPIFHCILRKNILMTSFFNPFSYFVARKMSDFWGLLQNILEGVALVPNLTALLQCDLIEGLLGCSSLRCRFVTNPGHCDVIPWFLNTQHICRTSWNIVEQHLIEVFFTLQRFAEHAWPHWPERNDLNVAQIGTALRSSACLSEPIFSAHWPLCPTERTSSWSTQHKMEQRRWI